MTTKKPKHKDILKGLGRGNNKYDVGFKDGQKSKLSEVEKVIEKEATKLWNDIYKETVEIDDLTSVIQILTDRIKKRLGIK